MSADQQQTGSIFSTTWNDAGEGDVVSYRQFSIPALIALVLGVASFAVFISLWFLFLGALGILLSLPAIVLIRRSEGFLTGEWAAQLGLSLSIVSLVSVSVFWPYYHYTVRVEADKFFRTWFDALRKHDIPVAYSLGSPFWERNPDPRDADSWWNNLPQQKYLHKSVHDYLANPVVKTLLELGPDADVSYFRTDSVATRDGADHVTSVYAVTYSDASGEPETFFLRMAGKRRAHEKDGRSAGWSLERVPHEVYRNNETE